MILVEIVLLVPQVDDMSIQRLMLRWNTMFKEAVKNIVEAIPCNNVPCQPTLAYRLSSATAKTPFVTLKTGEDWEGLREMILLAEGGKKLKGKAPAGIPVNIELGPNGVSMIYFLWHLLSSFQYIESLRERNKKGKKGKIMTKSTSGAAKYQKKSSIPTLLNLDGDEYGLGEGSDDDPNNDLLSPEIKQLAILDRSLLTCQQCGPNTYCKIDKGGTHVSLMMPQ